MVLVKVCVDSQVPETFCPCPLCEGERMTTIRAVVSASKESLKKGGKGCFARLKETE